MNVRASVLVLSHNRPMLLQRSVASALNQTVVDLEVLIVGDGVTDAVRNSANQLCEDPRVRFLDYPKGENHGESHRHTAIGEAQSNAIFYLCDDDLFLPTHVESLLAALEQHSFAQSRNCWVDDAGRLLPYPADLASELTIAWHLRDDVQHNAVSVTGTAHRRDFYYEVGSAWTMTPAGRWPDHEQWRKLMAHPHFSGATTATATALQFPNGGTLRSGWTEQQRADELDSWMHTIEGPDAQRTIDDRLAAGAIYSAEQLMFDLHTTALRIALLENRLETMESSRSWTITAPLRRLYAWRARHSR